MTTPEMTQAGDATPGLVMIAQQPAKRIEADRTANSRRRTPDVAAVAFRPSGRRYGWHWIVLACPFCSAGAVSSVHVHRGGASGGRRRSGCDRGDYRLTRTESRWTA